MAVAICTSLQTDNHTNTSSLALRHCTSTTTSGVSPTSVRGGACARINTRSRRSSIMAVHCRRPCLSRGLGASVEQSARILHGVNVAAHVQATPEVCTVREKLLNTGCFQRLEHVPSHVILFAFNFVLCPCSCSDIMPL